MSLSFLPGPQRDSKPQKPGANSAPVAGIDRTMVILSPSASRGRDLGFRDVDGVFDAAGAVICRRVSTGRSLSNCDAISWVIIVVAELAGRLG